MPKFAAGFFEGVCALNDQVRISTEPPHPPFVDRFMPLVSLSNQVSASHRSECLCTAPISCAWQL